MYSCSPEIPIVDHAIDSTAGSSFNEEKLVQSAKTLAFKGSPDKYKLGLEQVTLDNERLEEAKSNTVSYIFKSNTTSIHIL